MVSPARRRAAVAHLQKRFSVSQRRACRAVHQPRSTERYPPKLKREEPKLLQAMQEWVQVHPRYGYRRIWALLVRDGWRINRKRVWRLWTREGFKVPQKQRKKKRLGREGGNGTVRRRPRTRTMCGPGTSSTTAPPTGGR